MKYVEEEKDELWLRIFLGLLFGEIDMEKVEKEIQKKTGKTIDELMEESKNGKISN